MGNKKAQMSMIKTIRNNLKYKNYTLGKNMIEEYILKYGSDCFIELEKAKYYHAIKDHKKAKEILTNLVNSNPKNIGYALYELGKLYDDMQMCDEAIETYKQIETTNHKNKEYAYFSLGNIYERLFDHKKAIEYFEKANFPDSALKEDSKLHIARNYIYLKEFETAKSYLESVLSHNNPKLTCLVLYYQAKIESYVGSKDDYMEMIDNLVTRYPEFNPGLAEKVRILFSQKKYKDGKNFLKKIHTTDTNPREFCSYKILSAEYYEKTSQYANALEIYEDIICNYDKLLTAVEKARVMIGIATCYIGVGKIDKGYEYFQKQCEGPAVYRNACLFNMLSIEIYRGNYEKAYELLQKMEADEENKIDIYDIKLMLNKFIEVDLPFNRNYSYREKLIVNYNKEEVIKHVNDGHGYGNAPIDEGAFTSNVDLDKLMDEVKEKLNEENIVGLNILKKHKLYYENIGEFDGDNLNYLIVVTLLYSNDIVTMYPTNELLEEKLEAKPKQKIIKRESQIEKFNRRYNKK